MKKLSELGISPAPWREWDDDVVAADDSSVVLSYDESYLSGPDAKLIAAAPELYEATYDSYEAMEGLCPRFGNCHRCLHGCVVAKKDEWLKPNTEYCTDADKKSCMIYGALYKAKAALAKAGGEEARQ